MKPAISGAQSPYPAGSTPEMARSANTQLRDGASRSL